MNVSYFIAKKISKNKDKTFSRFIIRLATIATAISVAIMILSVAIVGGFKSAIQNKMFVFWGHFHIVPFNPNPSSLISPKPIQLDPKLLDYIKKDNRIEGIYPFTVKPAIANFEGKIAGLKIKGVDESYPFISNDQITYSGEKIDFKTDNYAQQVIVSEFTLKQLNSKIGDELQFYFIDPNESYPRIRKLKITGTYHTGVEEIDQSFVYADTRLIQRINNWGQNDINGYQIGVKDYKETNAIADEYYEEILAPPLYAEKLEDIYPGVYHWLETLNINAQVLLVIMSIVALINIITALLIYILERTNMIGMLKALGMPNKKIQLIFFYHSLIIAVKGISIGLMCGLAIAWLQQHFKIIKLNESVYSLSSVPIELNVVYLFLIIIGVFICCMLIMFLPTIMAKKVNISKALRFE